MLNVPYIYEKYFQNEWNKNTIKNIHARLINNRDYVKRNIAKRIGNYNSNETNIIQKTRVDMTISFFINTATMNLFYWNNNDGIVKQFGKSKRLIKNNTSVPGN